MRFKSVVSAVVFSLAAIVFSTSAQAQGNLEGIIACTNIGDDAARLACFDAAVPELQATLEEQDEERRAAMERDQNRRSFFGLPRFRRPDNVQETDQTEEEFGAASMDRRARAELEDEVEEVPPQREERLDEIRVRVVEWGTNQLDQVFIVLENGQVWRQTEYRRIPMRRNRENFVTIRRNLFGSYSLKPNDSNQNYPVERIQ